MKHVLITLALLLGGAAWAAPLDELVDTLNIICESEVGSALLEQVGEGIQDSMCVVRDFALRGEGLIATYESGTDAFIRQAFRDGFDLLDTYTEFDTDLGPIQAFSGEIDTLIRDGVSLEGALGFMTRTAGAQRISELLQPSGAEEGSLQYTVEEGRRLNPAALTKELQTIETVAQTQEKAGEALDVANDAMGQAVASIGRGDEGDLMLNLVDPLPTERGIVEEAAEQGEKAVSTRAAVQVLLDFQTKAVVQSATEMTSLITAVKENGLQSAQTTKAMSFVARELYAQRLAESNKWRSEKDAAVEEAYNDAMASYEGFAGAAELFESSSASMGRAEAP